MSDAFGDVVSNLSTIEAIVTRPGKAGLNLCSAIEQRGGKATHFPTLEIEPLAVDVATKVREFKPDWLIAVSRHAVCYGAAAVEQGRWKWAAVGAATAAQMQSSGINDVLYCESNQSTEGLLSLQPLADLTGQRVMIIRGVNGRETLAEQLRLRGAEVTYLEVYRRMLPQQVMPIPDALLMPDGGIFVIAASHQAVLNLLQLLGHGQDQEIPNIHLLVISQRMAGLARTLGFDRITVAKNASNAAILEAMS